MADPKPQENNDDAEEAAILAEMQRRGMSVPGVTAPEPTGGVTMSSPAMDPMGVPAGADAVVSDGTQNSDPIGRAVVDIVRGVAVEGPGALVRGVGNAIKESGDFVTEGAQALSSTGQVGKALVAGLNTAAPGVVTAAAPAMSWLGEKVAGLFDKRETVTGNVIESISQFATGMIGAGKFVALPKLAAKGFAGKVAEGVVRGAVADPIVFDGNDKRLSNLIEDFPELQNPITEYLSAKDDDPEMLGRVKNALEGAIIGPAADLLLLSLKARKLFAAGDNAGGKAAVDEAEAIMARLQEAELGGSAQDAAVRSLDPENGVTIREDGTLDVPVVAKREPGEAPKGPEGEAPRSPDEPPPRAPEGSDAAPFSTDLTMPKDGRGPLEMRGQDVVPPVSKADAERTVAALQSKFAVAGREMVEEGKDFNFRTIANDDDLRAAMNAVSAAQEKLILRTKGGNYAGVLTTRTVIRQRDELADMFMADPDHMMIALGNDAKNMNQMAARFQAYKMMMQKAVNDAATKANATASLTPGSPEFVKASSEALHSAMIASQIQAMVKGVQTNTARTLNAMKIAAPSDVLKKGLGDYEELVQRIQSGTFHTDDARFLKHLASLKDNPKGFIKYMEQSFGQKVKGAYTEWLMNSMLSGPKTHLANLIGNTLMTGYMPLERAVAGMMPGSRLNTGEVLGKLKDEYDGLGLALMDSFRVAGIALRQNRSILDPHNSSAMDAVASTRGAFSARTWGYTKDLFDTSGALVRTETTPVMSAMLDGIQNVVSIPSRLLTTADEFFKQVNYRSYLYVEAAARARKAGLKSGTPEFSNYVGQEMTRGFDSNGVAAALSPDATVRGVNGEWSRPGLQQAREATFTQDLEYGVSRWLQGMANDSPWVRTIVPFVRTPVNIFRFAIKHGPLAGFEAGFRADLRAGGDRARKAMAQLTMGAGMWTTAIWLANNGVITGGFSANPEVRQAQEMDGAKEYAVKLGDKYVQYNRLEPYATVFGIAADMAKVIGHISEADADKLSKAATVTLARNIGSKTYVQGLVNVFNAINDAMSGRSTQGLESFFYKTTASIAIPSIVNTYKDDEALRQVRNMLDAFRARTDASEKVPPVRNFLGQVVDAPQGWLIGAASPLGYGKLKGDALYTEVAELMGQTQAPFARVMPNLGNTVIDLREVTLKSGQNAYDRMQQLLWESNVKGTLEKLIDTDAYKAAKNGSPDYPTADGSKSWLINRMLQQHKEIARSKLLAENPELLAMYQQEMVRSKTEGFLGPQEPAYRKPGFLESLFGKSNDLSK